MYEPSRNLLTFHIAGFQHHDGALVPSKIKAGDVLALVPEPDNPYDPDAVAVKYGDVMLGYVPADSVGPLSVMFHYGHGDAFECVVIPVSYTHLDVYKRQGLLGSRRGSTKSLTPEVSGIFATP